MQVTAGHLSAALVHHGRTPPGDRQPTPSEGPQTLVEAAALRNAPDNVTDTARTVTPERSSGTPGDGPVSLIENGHFKGVADARLRLNFSGRLSERADERVREQVQHGAESLTELVRQQTAKVSDVVAAGPEKLTDIAGLTDQLATSFTEFAGTTSAQRPSTESMAASFTEMFEDYAAKLRTTLSGSDAVADRPETFVEAAGELSDPAGVESPSVTQQPAAAPSPPSTGEPTFQSLDDAFTAMRSAFDAALTKLMASIEDGRSQFLAPAPPTEGNGAAYDKFVAMLAKLSDGHAAESLDTSA